MVAPNDMEKMGGVLSLLFGGAMDCSNGKYDTRKILNYIKAGNGQLWVLVTEGDDPKFLAAAATEVQVHPDHKTARMWMAGGDFEALMVDGQETFYEYARAQGCQDCEIEGPEWIMPFLARHSFKLSTVVMRKEL